MDDLRVACVSMNGYLGQPERSLANIEIFSREAAGQGVDLVLFPELVVHGHNTPDTPRLAEAVPDGPSCQRLAALCAELDLFLSVGLSERDASLFITRRCCSGRMVTLASSARSTCLAMRRTTMPAAQRSKCSISVSASWELRSATTASSPSSHAS